MEDGRFVDNVIVAEAAQQEELEAALGRTLLDAGPLGMETGDYYNGAKWTRNVDGEQVPLPVGDHPAVEEALRLLADELGLAALSRFATVVSEALAFGSPLSEALERQARVIRDEQRAQVEEEIERVPVKMLVPLGTLIVPAMFLAILGPLLGSVLVGR